MSTFASLSPAQQASLLNSDLLLRSAIVAARRAVALMEMASIDYATISQPIFALLDAGTAVPTTTGLAGAVPVPKEQVDAVMTQFATLVATWNAGAVLVLHVELVGAANLNGQV